MPNHTINHPNVTAFLAMIRDAEGTSDAPDPYRVVYSYNHTIEDLSDHPTLTGEWKGARFGTGKSTAAGAYQFILKTWRGLKAAGAVWDFSPESQDAGAITLISWRGALDFVIFGDLKRALAKTSYEWASLPPSRYGQPQRTFDWCVARFEENDGTIGNV